MTKTFANLFFILITSTLLASCGFHLNSIKTLPPQLHKIYYQTEHPYEKFELAFKNKLKSNGATLLPAPKITTPTINISSNYSSNNNNPASSTQARIYNLTYTATISINNFYNQPILAPQTASVSRSLTLQPNEVFETTPQAEITKQEMIRELSTKILNILSSSKTFQALENMTIQKKRISDLR